MSEDSVENQMPLTTNKSSRSVDAPANGNIIDIHGGVTQHSQSDAAFTRFYEAQRPGIVRALSLALHDNDFGVDAADEAFVRACQRWSTVSELDNPAGWVYRVGLNWANSVLRRRRMHRSKQSLLANPNEARDVRGDIDLQRALGELSADHRSVVICRYYLDWSVGDTADALDIPPGTVKSRLARALEQLESILRPTPPDIGCPQ